MRHHTPRSFELTAAHVAAHAGGPVVCLLASATGSTYRLHRRRPGAELNRILRADSGGNYGQVELTTEVPAGPVVMRVDVAGVLEQRAGYHDVCGGWTDGHDAVSERFCAALAQGDVLAVCDSPGGAVAGIQEGIRRVLEAKAKHGRRITGYVNELCASAMFWWMACVCDEIFGPPAMAVGSIGARGAHMDVSVALAKEGVKPTLFAWPDDGKIAGVPELPLSDVGRERAQRCINEAGEAFAAAVGPPRGLTYAEIRAMSADIYTGAAAVRAKLADGVATLEEVMEYALARAGGGEGMSMGTENDEPKGKAEGDEEERSATCGTCGDTAAGAGRYCARCGASLTAADAAKPDEEDEEPASARPGSAAPAAARGVNYASIAGVHADASDPAIMSALLAQKHFVSYAISKLGVANIGQARGALDRVVADAAGYKTMRVERKSALARADKMERIDLLKTLQAIGGPEHTRGKLFVDVVTPEGEVTGIEPAPLWSDRPEGRTLENLRGYVRQAQAGAVEQQRDPYHVSSELAARLSGASEAQITEQDRRSAEQSGLDPAQVARTRQALDQRRAANAGGSR